MFSHGRFKPRDGGLRGADSNRHIGLCQAGRGPRFEDLVQEFGLFRKPIVLALDLRPGQRTRLEMIKVFHHLFAFDGPA